MLRLLPILLALLTALARGQDIPAQPQKPTADQPLILAAFGFSNIIKADHWSPITVYITCAEQPLAGTIVVDFPQDSTQSASIAVPFAATPNRTTPVQIVAALPHSCDRVNISLYSDRGRLLRTLSYTGVSSSYAAKLPDILDAELPIIGVVGRSSLPDAARDWATSLRWSSAQLQRRSPPRPRVTPRAAATAPTQPRDWANLLTARIAPEELPTTWTAYDSLAAVVVHAGDLGLSATPDPRAIAAIHEWVASGGRLIIIADTPGEAWRSWLPERLRAEVTLAPAAPGPCPPDIAAAFEDLSRLESERLLGSENDPSVRIVIPPPAASIVTRPITLSDAARDAGWSSRWSQTAEPAPASAPAATPAPAPAPSQALLAEGPYGFGAIAILGLDPAKAPSILSTRAAGAVWRTALGPVLGDLLHNPDADASRRGYYGSSRSSRAVNTALERLGDVPIVGDWVFLVIAGFIGILALLVGPADFFLLRRLKAGHRSWITALLWVSIASVAAYVAPRFFRAAPTQVNRITVVDRLIAPGAAAAPPGEPGSLSFADGITGLYAGQSGRLRFTAPDPASWWRGVAFESVFNERGPRGPAAMIPTLQAAAGGAAGSQRGNPVVELPMGLWTFRTLADMSRPGPESPLSSITARIYPASGGFQADVAGLPPGVMVTEAAIRLGGAWVTITEPRPPPEPPKSTYPIRQQAPRPRSQPKPVGRLDGSSWSARFPLEFARKASPYTLSNPDPDPNAYYWVSPFGQLDLSPGPLLDLPGPARRAAAVERRLASGRWAAVYLSLSGVPLDTPVDWPHKADHTCVLRLLVPLEAPVDPVETPDSHPDATPDTKP